MAMDLSWLPPGTSPGKLPLGMRVNNPGNIKFFPGLKYPGMLGPSGPGHTDQGDPQMTFDNPQSGMNAAAKLAWKKYRGGKRSPNALIAGQMGWTPGNTAAAANVARTLGIDPNADMNLSDPKQMSGFLRALVTQEHGPSSKFYGDDLYQNAAAYAVNGQEAPPMRRPTLGDTMTGNSYIGGTAAAPAQTVQPGMPPEALVAPSGRYSKLADALMASAAGAKPRGWGDLLNASGDLALGYTLADKADTRQQEYQSKLSQMLSGADASALPDTLIQSGDPALMQAGVQAKMQQAQAQAKANAPLRGKERFMSTPGGVMDVETMQIVPGTEKDDGNKPIKVGDTLVQKGPDGKYVPVYAPDPGKADPDRVKLEQGLRKEFASLSKDYRSIEEGADRVRVGSELNNAVGDLSLIFGYMKLLDPGSVVREGEFANAENAQGVPDRIRNTWNKIMSGERLNPQTRQEFVEAANKLAEQQVGRQNRIVEQFKGIAGEAGLDPERIIMDFGPSESPPPPPPPGASGDQTLPGQQIPQEAINELKANPTPEAARYFDEVFGPGAAQRAFGR